MRLTRSRSGRFRSRLREDLGCNLILFLILIDKFVIIDLNFKGKANI